MKSIMKITGCMLLACILSVPSFANGSEDTTQTTGKKIQLTMLTSRDNPVKGIQAVCDNIEKKEGIKVDLEFTASGTELDNLLKTRLAAGDAPDLIVYNTGSLLPPLDPANNFIDISSEPYANKIDTTFKKTASVAGKLYAIPFGLTQTGAVMYNKKVYKQYGLSIPKTWKEFLHNCDVLKKNGETALIGTFKDSWTSQVLFLGDNYNVCKDAPQFPEEFEKGTMKYATTPAALRSWQKLADTTSYYNSDYLASSVSDGCDMLATGKGAQWIMLTDNVLPQIAEMYPDQIDDIGVFAIPGDDPKDQGLTIWEASGIYGNKNSKNVVAIKKFMQYYMSTEGLNAYCSALDIVDGPVPVIGYTPTGKTIPAVQDMNAYFKSGKIDTALEYKTSVKGANAPNICCECASGQTSAEEAAKIYDEDCRKQAIQLGLNWK